MNIKYLQRHINSVSIRNKKHSHYQIKSTKSNVKKVENRHKQFISIHTKSIRKFYIFFFNKVPYHICTVPKRNRTDKSRIKKCCAQRSLIQLGRLFLKQESFLVRWSWTLKEAQGSSWTVNLVRTLMDGHFSRDGHFWYDGHGRSRKLIEAHGRSF